MFFNDFIAYSCILSASHKWTLNVKRYRKSKMVYMFIDDIMAKTLNWQYTVAYIDNDMVL